jgi:hypothetical protein
MRSHVHSAKGIEGKEGRKLVEMNTPQGHTLSRGMPIRDVSNPNHHPSYFLSPSANPFAAQTTKMKMKEKRKTFQHFQRHF